MRQLILCSTLTFVVAAFGCGANANWEELSPAEGQFSVLMPGKAAKEVTEGVDRKYINYTVIRRSVTYTVSYTDLRPGEIKQTLTRMKFYWQRNGWTVTKETESPVEGCQWEQEAQKNDSPNEYYSGRKYETATRAYEVKVQGDGATLNNPEVRKFLDSFKVIK
jgi:hypothetical protein